MRSRLKAYAAIVDFQVFRAWVSTGTKGAWHLQNFWTVLSGTLRFWQFYYIMLCFTLKIWGFTSDWHPLFQIPNWSPEYTGCSISKPHCTGISCQNFFHTTIIPPWRVSWVSRKADKLKELGLEGTIIYLFGPLFFSQNGVTLKKATNIIKIH